MEFIQELEILQRMESNRYTGKEGTEDGHRPTQHCSSDGTHYKNKELHAALQAQKTGESIWTVFCPATHRHIYTVFESIMIDTYAAMDTLPALYNQRGGESIDTYLDGYDNDQNISVFCFLMHFAHTEGKELNL